MHFWFEENHNDQLRMAYKVKDVLFRGHSDFQSIEILDTEACGRVMVIDGMVMVTEADEFVYHELIAHIPALLHPNPRRAVIIGGGDGGTARELLRHPSLESIVLCEIDGMVVAKAKEFLPELSQSFSDPRLNLVIGDGIAYVNALPRASADLIVIDSTDPIGPGEGLFAQDFYAAVSRALAPGGLMVCQSESAWYDEAMLKRIQASLSSCFRNLKPYVGFVPSYPQGLWTWTLAADHPIDITKLDRRRFAAFAGELRYLTDDLLAACFAVPKFYQNKISDLS